MWDNLVDLSHLSVRVDVVGVRYAPHRAVGRWYPTRCDVAGLNLSWPSGLLRFFVQHLKTRRCSSRHHCCYWRRDYNCLPDANQACGVYVALLPRTLRPLPTLERDAYHCKRRSYAHGWTVQRLVRSSGRVTRRGIRRGVGTAPVETCIPVTPGCRLWTDEHGMPPGRTAFAGPTTSHLTLAYYHSSLHVLIPHLGTFKRVLPSRERDISLLPAHSTVGRVTTGGRGGRWGGAF